MTRNQKIRRVTELVEQGLTFRAIEARLRKTLGIKPRKSNGTVAFRLYNAGKRQNYMAFEMVQN